MSILNDFFDSLNKEISYCHWKSIDRMDEVYEGTSDIDILIDRKQLHTFHHILNDYKAISIKPRLWMTYPSMEDYLLYDNIQGRFYHLHVHYKLIMGKKNAKEYILPLEDLYLSTRIKHEKYDTYIVKPEIDLLMLLLRYAVKYGKINIYYQKTKGFKVSELKEMSFLISRINVEELIKYAEQIDTKLNLEGTLLEFITEGRYLKIFQNINKLKRIQSKILIYRRISSSETYILRKLRKYLNIYAVRGRNNAKHPVAGGITIAMIGCDGSGKTTVTNELIKSLRTKLSARKYYMGFNSRSYSLLTKIFVLLSYPPRSAKFIFKNSFGRKINIFGQLIVEYGGYLDRKRLYRQSLKDKANGMIGFYERYPLKNTIDYPQCLFNEEDLKVINSSSFLKRLSYALVKKYEIFKPADLNFFIKTPPNIIRERREMPDKTFEKVKVKYDRVSNFVISRDYFFEIDGSEPLEKVVLNVKNKIFESL